MIIGIHEYEAEVQFGGKEHVNELLQRGYASKVNEPGQWNNRTNENKQNQIKQRTDYTEVYWTRFGLVFESKNIDILTTVSYYLRHLGKEGDERNSIDIQA